MKSSFPEATVITREELYVGLSARLGREIMKEDIYSFARTPATLIRCMSAPTTQSSYSLGRATQEYTVGPLVPELALKETTVNVVSPSHIATGINEQTGDKQQMKEAAMVPVGRISQEEDWNGRVRCLLSPEAFFVSRQIIPIPGAKL